MFPPLPTPRPVVASIAGVVAFAALVGGCAFGPEEAEKDWAPDVALDTCRYAGGTGRADVTVTNSGDEPAHYRVEVAFLAPGGERTYGVGSTTVADAEPGAATDGVVSFAGGLPDMECEISDVDRSG